MGQRRRLIAQALQGVAALGVGLALLLPVPAAAWTDRPVRLLIPSPPGGTVDIIARLVGDQLAQDIGQPVVVEGRPGAGGGIAVQALRSAPADGQTLMMTASNLLTEIPHVVKLPYDTLKDLRPIAVVARSTMVLVGRPQLPVTDVAGLVAYARAHPGKLSVASYSAGTASHYAAMIFNQRAGLDLQHVPFAGSPPALTQLMGGHVDVMFDGLVSSRPLIAAGKIAVYAVGAAQRLPQLPGVPTMAEQGYPDIQFSNWLGVIGPGNLPNDVAEKIRAALLKVMANPKVRERIVAAGFELADDLNTAPLAPLVRAEFERNAALVKQFNIQASN